MDMGELVRGWARAERKHATERVGDSPWPLHRGASEADVRALEAQLGTHLPPSYRTFLLESNGTEPVKTSEVETQPDMHGIYSIAEVGWLRDVDRKLIEIWMESADPEHDNHTPVTPDPWSAEVEGFCAQCMPDTLAIAEADEWLLLNPGVVDADGEWECWRFGSWIPGAYRYRSFRAYLGSCAQELDAAAVDLPDPYTRAAWAANDESILDHKRLEAISKLVHGPSPQLALKPAVAMMTTSSESDQRLLIFSLAQLLRQGHGEELIVRTLVPFCAVAASIPAHVFEVAVPTLALSRHPDAIAAVKAVLQDVDSAHTYSFQEALHPAEPLDYAREWWQLWDVTGDPAYLLKLGYAGDERAVEEIRQFVDDPRDYRLARGASRSARDTTVNRMRHLLDNTRS